MPAKQNRRVKSIAKVRANTKRGSGTTHRTISAPIAKGQFTRNVGGQNATTNVKKCEYIMEVNPSSTRFTRVRDSNSGLLTAFTTLFGNIGLGDTFKWASTLAPAFENFIFNACRLIFKPSSATTQQGSGAFVPFYDPTRPFPTDKSEIMGQVGASRGPLWHEFDCKLDPKKMNAQVKCHKVRTSEPESTEELRQTDPWKCGFYLDGAASNSSESLGEIWVDYDVTLTVPKGALSDMSSVGYTVTIPATTGAPTYDYDIGTGTAGIQISTDTTDSDYYGVRLTLSRANALYRINFLLGLTGTTPGPWTLSSQNLSVLHEDSSFSPNTVYCSRLIVETPVTIAPLSPAYIQLMVSRALFTTAHIASFKIDVSPVTSSAYAAETRTKFMHQTKEQLLKPLVDAVCTKMGLQNSGRSQSPLLRGQSPLCPILRPTGESKSTTSWCPELS